MSFLHGRRKQEGSLSLSRRAKPAEARGPKARRHAPRLERLEQLLLLAVGDHIDFDPGEISNARAASLAAVEGDDDNWEVASFDDSSPDATAEEFSAVIHWGDAAFQQPDDVGRVIATGNGHFVIMDSRAFDVAGSVQFQVTVYDGSSSTFTSAGTARIVDAPLSGQAQDVVGVLGQPITSPVAAFTDPDRTSLPGDFRATIDWGDGAATLASIIPGPPGRFFVAGAHQYFDIGTYPLKVTITDLKGHSAGDGMSENSITLTSSATVISPFANLASEPVTAIEGDDSNWQLASFHAADPNATAAHFSAEVVWDDYAFGRIDGPVGSPASIHDLGNGQFLVTADHKLRSAGSFDAHVVITTNWGVQATVDTPVSVADLPLPIAGIPISAVQGQVATRAIAIFTDTDPSARVAAFTAAIDWGDGTSSSGKITPATTDLMPTKLPGLGFVVTGAHTYQHSGAFLISVKVTDLNVFSSPRAVFNIATATATATVFSAPIIASPAPSPFAATEGVALGNTTVATFSEAGDGHNDGEFMAVVDWGDHSGSVGSIVTTPAGFAVQSNHVYLDPGVYTIRIIVQGNDQTASITETISVAALSFPITGALDSASDTGASASDGITNINAPTFRGVTAANVSVLVVGTAVGGSLPLYVGQTQSDNAGNWSITLSPLTDGRYSFVAYAENAAGRIRNQVALAPNGLVIDTMPPSMTVASFSTSTGRLVFTVTGDVAGLDRQTAMNASGYMLKGTGKGGRTYLRPKLAISGIPGGPMTITATFNGGRRLAAGPYSASLDAGTIRDIAGNSTNGLLMFAPQTKLVKPAKRGVHH
jgi:PKD repeat protein